jgi:hypothetical protein
MIRLKRNSGSALVLGILFAAVFAMAASHASENVRADFFPERIKVDGKELSLNGIGTRTATLFAVKVYHAAFYADRSIASLQDALAAPIPMRLDIRYVRDFDLKQTTEAWRYQFHESGGVKDGILTKEIDALVGFQKPIKDGDVQRFDLENGKTAFYINDEKRGEITGEPFQKALLTIFFGPNPPTRDLQKGLTRGIKTSTKDSG